ncbi:MAG: MBL fold metallo-hydrolase [Planctomycetia bacterium]|nr:MBL fold metallo-hydrolase [Planctomycetia bacterium]
MIKLTFHGAAETVTGSKYLLETDRGRILIDCGLFQGLKELRQRNWNPLPFPAASVDAVVLTHAHIDHIGYLPHFVKSGFEGRVLATPATVDLMSILLLDSARNQENDAEYANRKGFSKHRPALPLYDERDVKRTMQLVDAVPREAWFNPAGDIWCRYHDAGHLLGSAMIEVEVRSGPKPLRMKPLRITFSGDVGRYDAPLYHDPLSPPACDYLICESTYGNRDHGTENVLDQLCDVVLASIERGGVMLTASFAVGRAQQIIYLLRVLIEQGRIPELPIYLDSPMASTAMDVFRKYAADHDLVEMGGRNPKQVLEAPNVHLARSAEESKRINEVAGPAVIIASSGMMTGGRILHHLKRRLPDPKTTLVVGGYQAEGTRGRDIQDGRRTIRVFGSDVPVRGHVAEISAISGHAGRSELLRWLQPLAPPKRTFITHGELDAANALAQTLRQDRGWNVTIPKMGEAFTLEHGT